MTTTGVKRSISKLSLKKIESFESKNGQVPDFASPSPLNGTELAPSIISFKYMEYRGKLTRSIG